MKNWQTTLSGILTLVAAVAPIWAPPEYSAKIQATAAVFAAGGLIVAKDHNKTGA